VEGPIDAHYDDAMKRTFFKTIQHTLSMQEVATMMADSTERVVADDGRVEIVRHDDVARAAGYMMLPETPALTRAVEGDVPTSSAAGLRGTGQEEPVLLGRPLADAGADLGISLRHRIFFQQDLLGIGAKLRSRVDVLVVSKDGGIVYKDSFEETSGKSINYVVGIADMTTLREALLDLGERSANRVRAVIRTGQPIES
jgi:hypothetical protein